MLWLLAGCAPAEPPADLVVLADPVVVVDDGRIVAVFAGDGAHQRGRARVGADTVVLEAPRVTAGFVDAHAHPVGVGRTLEQLDLVGLPTLAETVARVARAPGDGWLHGRGWDQNDWTDAPAGGWPTAGHLDAVVGDRPVVLRRVDGHAAWLSSSALAAAGVDATTPDPDGGRLVRDADGVPTGVLIDNAMALIPADTAADVDRRRWATAAAAVLVQSGLTGVHAMGVDDATLAVLEALDAEGGLPLRLWVYADPGTAAAERLATSGPWGGDRVKVVGVKAYADGALGSRGALLSADYTDEPGHRGLAVTPADGLTAQAVAMAGGGAQLAVHAIGDQAVHHALDAFAAARQAHPDSPGRHRVEHAQVVHPDDVARFAELGAIASMQPTHCTSDMPWAPDRLGPERTPWSYAWRTLADAGATLAFGSDAPVESYAPTHGLWAAITRTDAQGSPAGGWRPDQRVTEAQAIAAFTSGAATAVFEEDRLGTLDVGKVADLSLWSVDGARFTPVATVVSGEVVWP